MSATTVIRAADWMIVWDGERHVFLRDGDLAFKDGVIVQAGGRFDGVGDVEISGAGRLVMPGLVNIHSHPTSEPLRKGVTDETRSPGFHHSSLYEYLTAFTNDSEGVAPSMRVAFGELALSGVTTVVDLSIPFDGWLDVMAESGLRCVVAPMFRDARWYTKDGHSLDYDWDEAAGRRGFEAAQRSCELARQHSSGRLSGMMAPAQIDPCGEALLRDAHDFAAERNLPYQIHVSQSVTEFHEIFRRHGKTPVQWMESIGVLDERAILGHAIFLDHHPWLHWTTSDDKRVIAESGASVAHCPTVFSRRGITLRTLGGYQRAGINVGIGTDTYPHDFLDEMRSAMMYARVIGETVDDLQTADVFNAATIGGATALGRPDLGRLAVGAAADIVVVDATHPSMRPVRDPLRSLLYVAGSRAVRDVYVGGEQVVAEGRLTTIDLDAALDELQAAQARSLAGVASRDWAGRSADELAPLSLPINPTRDL
ncbi:MAG: cytosine/adenosine deaminase-related metal-dependent hydrolase [Alphaproteobacteria bacterium]|jgi:5-methylthioadenosine/S-adenosylhomocysteine deaminase